MMKSVVMAGAAASLLAVAGAAFAQPDHLDTVPSIAVPFADLDLQTDAGAQSMYARIDVAADRICRDEVNTPVVLHNRVCREVAIDRAVHRLDAPRVTALLGTTPNIAALPPTEALTESDMGR